MLQQGETQLQNLNQNEIHQQLIIKQGKKLRRLRRTKKKNIATIQQKKLEQQRREFAGLANIYIQNPKFLKVEQLQELLTINKKKKKRKKSKSKQDNTLWSSLNKKPIFDYQQRVKIQLEKRKIDNTFQICLKSSERQHEKKIETLQYPSSSSSYRKNLSIVNKIPQSIIIRKKEPLTLSISNQKKSFTIQKIASDSIDLRLNFNTQNLSKIFKKNQRYQKYQKQKNMKFNTSRHHYHEQHTQRQKFFILDSRDDYVRRFLEKCGWKQNKMYLSNIYSLKWSYKQDLDEYKHMENLKRYYNHIKGNHLTSKTGLYKIYKCMIQAGIKAGQFIPRTYLIEQQQDIATDFELTCILIILKKHINYIKQKKLQIYLKIQKLIKRKCKKSIQQQQFGEFLQKKDYFDEFDQDFLVNIPILIQCMIILEKYRRNKEGLEQLKLIRIYQDQKMARNIIKFSRIDPPYQNYFKFKSSNIKQEYSCNTEKNTLKTTISLGVTNKNPWATPSFQTIYKLIYYYIYYNNQLPWYNNDGLQNIWIIKPSSCSRGVGIFLTDKLEVLQQNKNNSKIVQKYLENIWIYDDIKFNKIQSKLSEQEIEYYKFHPLMNKKFDIRQWILITSVNPLKVYIFNKFYLKICSQKYNLKDLKYSKHLSNYSLNKNLFQDQTTSILKQQQFQKLLNKFDVNYSHIKTKIKQIIKKTFLAASDYFQPIEGCFQLIGADLIFDANLNPWLIQLNMSPACTQRTEWLTEMLQQMIKHGMQLILPNNILEIPQQIKENKNYHWQQLIINQKYTNDYKFKQKLQVIGQRINQITQKKRDKIFNIEKQKLIIKLQRKIRQYLQIKRKESE